MCVCATEQLISSESGKIDIWLSDWSAVTMEMMPHEKSNTQKKRDSEHLFAATIWFTFEMFGWMNCEKQIKQKTSVRIQNLFAIRPGETSDILFSFIYIFFLVTPISQMLHTDLMNETHEIRSINAIFWFRSNHLSIPRFRFFALVKNKFGNDRNAIKKINEWVIIELDLHAMNKKKI